MQSVSATPPTLVPSAPPPPVQRESGTEIKEVTVDGQLYEQECAFTCSLKKKREHDLDLLLSSATGIARRAPVFRSSGLMEASQYKSRRAYLNDLVMRTNSLYKSDYRVKNINARKNVRVGTKEYIDFIEDAALVDELLNDIE